MNRKFAAAAIAALNAAAISWSLATQASETVPAGTVISQNPPAGIAILGTTLGIFNTTENVPVSFVVSSGATAVPTYTFLSQFGDTGTYQAGNGQFRAAVSLAIDPASRNIFVGGEDGRVQVVNVDLVVHGAEAKGVGSAVGHAPAGAAAKGTSSDMSY